MNFMLNIDLVFALGIILKTLKFTKELLFSIIYFILFVYL